MTDEPLTYAESGYGMSDSEALSFNRFPLEVLHGVFSYFDIPDILRVRGVSRYLNEVSHSREVWSDAYRNADFVHPPGPFLSQSAHALEGALIPSFRVDRNLGHGDPDQWEKQTLKLREIRYTGLALQVSLVFGRFLFIALSEEVRCYDLNLDTLDSNSGATIIYRSASGSLKSFHCASAIDVEGCPIASAVLSEEVKTGSSGKTTTQFSIYALDVGEQSEMTLDLLCQFEDATFEVYAVHLGPRVTLVEGQLGSAIDAEWRLVALDVQTRTRFLIPSLDQAMWHAPEVPEWTTFEELTRPTSISTSTHLLVARSFYTQSTGWCTFLQAFALPPPENQSRFMPVSISLSPSHEGTIHGINVCDVALLRDVILDGSTRDVLITLRVHAYEPTRPRSAHPKYGILRLHGTTHGEHGKVTFGVVGSLGRLSHIPFFHPSFNGAGRVFYTVTIGVLAALEFDIRGGRDDSDSCDGDKPGARVVEHPSVLRFPAPRTLLDYDPYFGRICLRAAMTKYSVIEILDLAV